MTANAVIRPTGTLLAWGWSLLPLGVVLLVVVAPIFLISGIAEAGFTGSFSVVYLIGVLAPWLGLGCIVTSIVMLVRVAQRRRRNDELMQTKMMNELEQMRRELGSRG